MHYGITTELLPLQQVLRVCQLCAGDLLGKLYYWLSNETSMLDQSWCAWNRKCAYLILTSQLKKLGTTIELDPKGYKITCQAFGLHRSPAEYSTMGHIVLDLTCHAYQPKSRERSTHPKKQVTFPLTEKKSVYPVHLPEPDEDDDDKSFVRSDRTADSEDEDDKPLVQPSSWKELVKEKRESAAERTVPAQLRRRKRTSSLTRPICATGTGCARKLAWAIWRRLDIGQKSWRWSFSQNLK